MSRLDPNTTVGRCVAEYPQTSRVFESLEIDYCCGGDAKLADVCQSRSLDATEVLGQLVRAIESSDEPGGRDWQHAPLTDLCDHIEQSHHAYLRSELPRLTSLIAKLVDAHGETHPELTEVRDVFAALRAELEPHMLKEEQILFPAIRLLELSDSKPEFPFVTLGNPIRMMEHEHDNAGAALRQLRQLTRDYRPPQDACPTYRTALDGLADLEANMHQHVHKENNILFPRAKQMEAAAT